MTTMNPVTQTIYEQLGGARFSLMTGVRSFVQGATTLQFKLKGRTANRSNLCQVVLAADDTYTVSFHYLNNTRCVLRARHEGVYADQLQTLFTKETGLYLSFGRTR